MPPTPRLRIAVGLAAIGLLLTSCVSGTGRDATYGLPVVPDLADLDGETVVADGIVDHRELIPGTQIVMAFSGDAVEVTAGCARLSGLAAVDGDELVLGHLSQTRQECDPALQDQDEWLMSFLTSRPRFERVDDDLYLSEDDTVLRFVPEDD